MSNGKFAWMWKTKLMFGFAVIMLVFVAAAAFNLAEINGMRKQLDRQNEKVDMKRKALELKVLVQELKDISSGLMISRDEQFAVQFAEKREPFRELIRQVGDTAATDDQMVARSRLIMAETEFLDLFDRAVGIIRNKSLTETDIQKNIESLYKDAQVQRDAIFDLVDKFYVDYSRDADAAVASTYRKMASAVTIMLVAASLALMATIIVSVTLVRSFLKPIRHMQRTMGLVGAGDLRHRIDAKSVDEFGQLGRSFDGMLDSVSGMIATMRGIGTELNGRSAGFRSFAQSTASANAEILKAIGEISTGADRQAAYTEQCAAIVAGLRTGMRDIVRSTDEMKRLGDDADEQAKRGAGTVSELREAAERSELMLGRAEAAVESFVADSAQIEQIARALSDIAGQTNLLALNASIEAARAGEHGKGFLVIADQVRQLADQSKASARSIGELVDSLRARMEDVRGAMETAGESARRQGAKVRDTLQAFAAIGRAVAELHAQTGRIRAMVARAEAGGDDLTDVAGQLAAIAQQTAAGVQEVNATSAGQHEAIARIAEQADAMHALAESLFEAIGKFKTEDGGTDATDGAAGAGAPATVAAPGRPLMPTA